MKLWNVVGAGAALILVAQTTAMADPIRTLPDLQSVTIYEITFATTAVTYAPNAVQLTTRLADPLTDANSDFHFVSDEDYDVFYSDADGTFNIDGGYLTIEGVWRPGGPREGGMNINEVELVFGGGNPSRFGDFVASFEYGFGDVTAGSEALAVDHNLGTFPRFGQTSEADLGDRFRLTIGFSGISDVAAPVPEPSLWLLLAAGTTGVVTLRRKRV